MQLLRHIEGLTGRRPEPKSAEAMFRHFEPILINNREAYWRVKPAYVKPANKGDWIQSLDANGMRLARDIKAKDNTSWETVDPSRNAERKLLQQDKFEVAYPHLSREDWERLPDIVIPAIGIPGREFKKRMRREGFKEVARDPPRMIWAKTLDTRDVAWIRAGGTGEFQIGDTLSRRVTEGDVLAMGFPGDQAVDVYLMAPGAMEDMFERIHFVAPQGIEDALGHKFNAQPSETERIEVEAKKADPDAEYVLSRLNKKTLPSPEKPPAEGAMLVRDSRYWLSFQGLGDWNRRGWQRSQTSYAGFDVYTRTRRSQRYTVTEEDMAMFDARIARTGNTPAHIWLESEPGTIPWRIQVGDKIAKETFADNTFEYFLCD